MIEKRTKRRLSLLLVLVIAALIFYFSAQPGSGSSSLSEKVTSAILSVLMPGFRDLSPEARQSCLARWDPVTRKAAHFSEYALLALALANYLRYLMRDRGIGISALVSWAVAVIYACTDELHQALVSGRSAKLTDVCIDAAGALFGALLCLAWLRLRRRRRTRARAE